MSNKPKKGYLTTFGRLFGYITPYWELKVIFFVIIITTVLGVLSPAIIGSIIDNVGYVAAGEPIPEATGIEGLTNRLLLPIAEMVQVSNGMGYDRAVLLVLSVSLIVIAVLEGSLNYIQRYTLEIISQRAGFDMRDDMYNSLLEQSEGNRGHQHVGKLLQHGVKARLRQPSASSTGGLQYDHTGPQPDTHFYDCFTIPASQYNQL
jgi:ABC-type multidrug transport system fused ATPase/permease subunit